MFSYESLNREERVLLRQALDHLEAGYDPASHLVWETLEDKPFRSVRASLYYALGLLMARGREAVPVASDLIGAVLALQFTDPGAIEYGTFRHPDEAPPPRALFDWRDVTPLSRYMADVTFEHIEAGLYARLLSSPALSAHAGEVRRLLRASVNACVPVCWDTYEPNLREFAGMVLAMLLHHFSDILPGELRERILFSARAIVPGALSRLDAGLTPLNTNIRIMTVFILDYFGTLLGEDAWRHRAEDEMRALITEYRELHAAAEFNSPTYCGVDLSTLGFFRRYSASPFLIACADEMEDGIWHDMADFYNPDMRNFCGPYSRCYELDMARHTCLYDLLYLTLGEERFPFHPLSIESPIAPLTVLGSVRMPPDLTDVFLGPCRTRFVRREFRELCERGDPRRRGDVCTAEAFISPRLMYGAMHGSRNPSHQLHPLVAFWRCGDGLGTIRIGRRLEDGEMNHLHTVCFDGHADGQGMDMTVSSTSPWPVEVFLEVACEGLEPGTLAGGAWKLPGLDAAFRCNAARRVEPGADGKSARVLFRLTREDAPLSLRLDLKCE